MKCRLLKENGIEIKLSREELNALDITYDKLDYANIETRRVLWTVLDEARLQLGSAIDLSGKMLIEAQSDGAGGCILDFTLLPVGNERSRGKLVKRDCCCLQLETNSVDAVLDAVQAMGENVTISLFADKEQYRLLCRTDTIPYEKAFAVLTEFGTLSRCSALQEAKTREHWQLLWERKEA